MGELFVLGASAPSFRVTEPNRMTKPIPEVPMKASDIIAAITLGQADDNLDGVESALRARKAAHTQARFFSLKADDEVRVLPHVRPKYLVGLHAKVVRHNKTRLVVRFIDPPNGQYGKFAGEVTVGADMIEPV